MSIEKKLLFRPYFKTKSNWSNCTVGIQLGVKQGHVASPTVFISVLAIFGETCVLNITYRENDCYKWSL